MKKYQARVGLVPVGADMLGRKRILPRTRRTQRVTVTFLALQISFPTDIIY